MKNENVLSILMLVTFLLILSLVVLYKANINAEVYNRETSSNISTWEAVWTDIRVDCK